MFAFELCARAYVLETGRVALAGTSEELQRNAGVRSAYLGGGLDVVPPSSGERAP